MLWSFFSRADASSVVFVAIPPVHNIGFSVLRKYRGCNN
jgi:hypothetical protein